MIDSISGFTTPTGFTMIHSEHNTTTNLRPEVVAFYKIAGGSEPAAYTSTATDFLSTAPMWKAVAVRVTGHDPTNPIQGHSGNSPTLATTSVTLPSLTTVVSNTLLVSAVTVRRSISSINVNPMTLQWFWMVQEPPMIAQMNLHFSDLHKLFLLPVLPVRVSLHGAAQDVPPD